MEAESGCDGQELEAMGGADEGLCRGRKGVAVVNEACEGGDC